MSGIAGIYSLEGEIIEEARLHSVIDRLAHRGRDAVAVWHSGSVGLGQCMSWTTPEAVNVALPLYHSASELTLVADARIDNRNELIALLNTDRSISDEELILRAYQKWGESCASKLIGAFAFAVWNDREKQLFCARDFAGVRPFYFSFHPGRFFCFGSEIKALLALGDIPTDVNEDRIADFLAQITVDHSYTFYRHVERLPAGHTITVSARGCRRERYFEYDPAYELRLNTDEEYAESFNEIFHDAVKARLRTRDSVATTLSGGLDSASITGLAVNLSEDSNRPPIHTFSAVFDEVRSCDEREYIEPFLRQIRVTPHFIAGDQQHPLGDLNTMLAYQDEPFTAPNAAMMWLIYQAISAENIRVVMSGHGGDETVSQGFGYLKELASARNWRTLARELRPLARQTDQSFGRSLFNYMKYGLAPREPSTIRQRLHGRIWRELSRIVDKRSGNEVFASANPVDLMTSDFRERTRIDERLSHWRRSQPQKTQTERERHFKILTDPLQQTALEVLDRTARAHGLELRFPFWDRRVVEYCLSIPPDQKLRTGYGRYVLRRGMEGILPDQIRWRFDKTDFTPNLLHGLRENDQHLLQSTVKRLTAIGEFVEISAVNDIIDRVSHQTATIPEMGTLLNVALLDIWMKSEKNRFQITTI